MTSPALSQLITQVESKGFLLPKPVGIVGDFGDTQADSEDLIHLVQAGQKRATASLLWSWQVEQEAVPAPGELEIVVNWQQQPVFVIEYTQVEILPFNQVSADFAWAEGEGDRSLTYWRRTHWDFFSRECDRLDRTASAQMPIVCAHFKLLFSLIDGSTGLER
ncbi:MAG: ASCH domain-containing protein [Leptolyngbya sp. SIO4C5]|nr:ASCH domain-containing protein [Leptolyngbya sp. SIO4C5]